MLQKKFNPTLHCWCTWKEHGSHVTLTGYKLDLLASTNFHIHSILTLRPFVNNQGFYEEILLTSCHPISLEYELQNRRFSLYSNNSIFNNLFWTIFKWFSYSFQLYIKTFSIQSEIFNFLNFKNTVWYQIALILGVCFIFLLINTKGQYTITNWLCILG